MNINKKDLIKIGIAGGVAIGCFAEVFRSDIQQKRLRKITQLSITMHLDSIALVLANSSCRKENWYDNNLRREYETISNALDDNSKMYDNIRKLNKISRKVYLNYVNDFNEKHNLVTQYCEKLNYMNENMHVDCEEIS